jgi:hypothetical protein
MTDDEMKRQLQRAHKAMGGLIREEEMKMLKLGQEARKKEQEAWDATKAILTRVGVKHG